MSANSDSPVRLPAGVRDYLPVSARHRHAIVERVIESFTAWGYDRVITPAFECADVLERGMGADARAQAVRFVEPGSGEVVALRPDFTPQIARMVASRMADVPGPIRLCYEGAVTRHGGAGQREILQAGIELIDASSPLGDGEVLAVASESLRAARLGEPRLDVGHVAPARWVLDACADERVRAEVKQALARKDRAAVRRATAGLPPDVAAAALALVGLWGDPERVLAEFQAAPFPDDVREAVGELVAAIEIYVDLVTPHVLPLSIDLGELRGGGYYTGVRFAGYARGAGDAVVRGGRYDNLVGRYGREARATGCAIDIEAMVQAQRGANVEPLPPASGIAIVVDADAEQIGLGGAMARHLRTCGWRVALVPNDRAPEQWARYVMAAGLDIAVVLGPPPHDAPQTFAREPAVLARLHADLAKLAPSAVPKGSPWLS